ncbi:MAG: bifunctional diaminohydroxyphosphoribosylaminopyrimidine [Actinomycetota bacterium]|jgi:diaminohydroxyphosphoribosylaminopyrimidine deaminase/5-amino-6-(5-phosphoribosylamino)uracil reductase
MHSDDLALGPSPVRLSINEALDRAFDIAVHAPLPPNPNPPVGCVILDRNGVLVGAGAHKGAGTAHAEIAALQAAGSAARGGTAVVTLEPCNHIGRTGSCAQALIAAGIERVCFAVADPAMHADSRAGREELLAAGVQVSGDLDRERGRALLGTWLHAIEHSRPFVTWKVASSADGFIAPRDRSRVQLTGENAMSAVHRMRSQVGAIVTGSGTVAADDPRLTARDATGRPTIHQPFRVVIGMSDVPGQAQIRGNDDRFIHLRTRNIPEALADLAQRGIHHVMLEAGPGLANAFLAAGCIDEIVWFTAPAVLGDGIEAASDFPSPTVGIAHGWRSAGVDVLGDDVRHTLLPADV